MLVTKVSITQDRVDGFGHGFDRLVGGRENCRTQYGVLGSAEMRARKRRKCDQLLRRTPIDLQIGG